MKRVCIIASLSCLMAYGFGFKRTKKHTRNEDGGGAPVFDDFAPITEEETRGAETVATLTGERRGRGVQKVDPSDDPIRSPSANPTDSSDSPEEGEQADADHKIKKLEDDNEDLQNKLSEATIELSKAETEKEIMQKKIRDLKAELNTEEGVVRRTNKMLNKEEAKTNDLNGQLATADSTIDDLRKQIKAANDLAVRKEREHKQAITKISDQNKQLTANLHKEKTNENTAEHNAKVEIQKLENEGKNLREKNKEMGQTIWKSQAKNAQMLKVVDTASKGISHILTDQTTQLIVDKNQPKPTDPPAMEEPTDEPTDKPTEKPTPYPTESLTEEPTPYPTVSPTESPEESPNGGNGNGNPNPNGGNPNTNDDLDQL